MKYSILNLATPDATPGERYQTLLFPVTPLKTLFPAMIKRRRSYFKNWSRSSSAG